jgi:hypothetical protein
LKIDRGCANRETYLLIVTIESFSAVIIGVTDITGEVVSAVEEVEDVMLVAGERDLACAAVGTIGVGSSNGSRGRGDAATIARMSLHGDKVQLISLREGLTKVGSRCPGKRTGIVQYQMNDF